MKSEKVMRQGSGAPSPTAHTITNAERRGVPCRTGRGEAEGRAASRARGEPTHRFEYKRLFGIIKVVYCWKF